MADKTLSGRAQPSKGLWVLADREYAINSGWTEKSRDTFELVVADFDGTELQLMLVESLRHAGVNGLANSIEALTVIPEVGYDATAARAWSLENGQGGTFAVRVNVQLSDGTDPHVGDYPFGTYSSFKLAVASVATRLGNPTLGAQIAAI